MAANISSIGLQGLQAAGNNINKLAEKIANPNASQDPVGDIVKFKQEETAFKASAKVVQVGAELDDTLLDILA